MTISSFWRVLLLLLLLAATAHGEECGLEPFDEESYAVVGGLAVASLPEKHAANLMGVLREPCSSVKQGLVIMGFKLKNTAGPLATLMTNILNSIDALRVAEMWALMPHEPRTWMLKAFVNSLPCRVAPGASKCDEEETNAVLAKFEEARFEFTQRRLAEAGLAPFPAEETTPTAADDPEDQVRHAMDRYVKRLGIDGPAAAWVLSEFKAAPPKNDSNKTLMVEPSWFAGISARCRLRAHAQVPEVRDADETAELADLHAATRVAMWAWHYKDCHRDRVLSAFQERFDRPDDDPTPQEEEKEGPTTTDDPPPPPDEL